MDLEQIKACTITSVANMDGLFLHQRFESEEKLRAAVTLYETNTGVKFTRFSFNYLQESSNEKSNRPELLFKRVEYKCISYKKSEPLPVTRKRRRDYIPGTGCQAGFTAHAQNDSLVIDIWNENHNCRNVAISSIATIDAKKIKLDDKSQNLIGLKFDSFQSILKFIKEFQKQENDVYVKRDSRKIKSDDLNEPFNIDLEYIYVKFVCKFGKASHTPKPDKQRSTSSYKLGCKFYIYAHITDNKQFLEIKKVNLEHTNHEDYEAFIGDVPEMRRLSPGTYQMALNSMDLNCSKKLLQNKIIDEKETRIRTKDLSNIHRKHKDLMTNDLKVVERILKSKGADVHVLHKNNEYQGLYFSTEDMRSSLKAWPDIVFLDGTYKVFNTNLSLMILLVEDSNGLSEIAGIGILAHEDYSSVKWFLTTVKNENKEACDNIKCFMTDKDLTERKVLKELFPNSLTQICRYHVLKIFSNQLSIKITNISNEEKNFCLSLLTKIVYSKSEDEYCDYYNTLVQKAPAQVVKYFNDNWHINKEEWCTYLMIKNLGNYTNNRLESLNGKVKDVVGLNNYLSGFVIVFFKWLTSHNRENDFKASKNFIKIQLPAKDYTEWEKLYSDYLTIKAFEYVQIELEHHDFITFWNQNNIENDINLDNIEEKYFMMCQSLVITTTCKSCECPHWLTLSLPCRHIFSIRKNYGMSLFSEELCALRWSKSYYRLNQRSFRRLRNKCVAEVKETQVSQVFTSGENFDVLELRKQLKYTINDITHTMSLSCGQYFDKKMTILSKISSLFDQGLDIDIEKVATSFTTNENALQSSTVPKLKVQSVWDKRKKIKPLTDKIDLASTSWLTNTWTDKLEALKKLDNFWRESIEVDVFEKQNNATVTTIEKLSSKKGNKFEPVIKLDEKCEISEVNNPVKVNPRGRPKGATLCVIGLPKKKTKMTSFSEKTKYEQASVLLNWMQLPATVINNVLRHEYIVKYDDISQICTVNNLENSFIHPSVKLDILKNYVDETSFQQIMEVIENKKKSYIGHCNNCNGTFLKSSKLKLASCDLCLNNYHFECVFLKKKPQQPWFCLKCDGKLK